LVERRGRDLNPRPTEPPATVFETAAFDRSATPPIALKGTAEPHFPVVELMLVSGLSGEAHGEWAE
jgi:hypothetical protein